MSRKTEAPKLPAPAPIPDRGGAYLIVNGELLPDPNNTPPPADELSAADADIEE